MKKSSATKEIRITMVGALGRMGKIIMGLAHDDSRFQLMAGVEHPKSPAIGRLSPEYNAPIVGNLEEVLLKTDVVIDFSSLENVLKTAACVSKHGRALVVGTTGLPPAAIKKLETYAKRAPIVYSPNMSAGMNLLFKLVQEAAQVLGHYDIEVIEAHHNLKKDSPSGTAMHLAEIAAKSSSRSTKDFVYGRQGMVGARKKKEIGVHAIRGGDIVGDHTVMLTTGGERLELTHRAHSREAFATGALDAAAWVAKKRNGLYNMHDVLGLKK